jgi:hypothetical protein
MRAAAPIDGDATLLEVLRAGLEFPDGKALAGADPLSGMRRRRLNWLTLKTKRKRF